MANTPRFNFFRGGNIDYGQIVQTGMSKNVPRMTKNGIVFGVPRKPRRARKTK